MKISRQLSSEVKEAASCYPVVTIIGPRQSGKTTLVKDLFTTHAYINLEAPDLREIAQTDPRGFLQQFKHGVILDEIQRVPQLLSYIQVIVDEEQILGKFILTGSHQLSLHQAISQSLAGRTAVLTLLPLTITELSQTNLDLSLDEYLLNGGYPRLYAHNLNPTKNYRNYFQTYVERDVRQLINLKDIHLFEKFVKLCAGRIGAILNKESLSNELGVSAHTVSHWLSILEASFIIFLLPPYFENFGKRILKSPKLYFTDVGLACYLLGIENLQQLSRDPLRGFLVENLVILELRKHRLNQGLDPQLYYYRDHHQNEIDIIFKSGQFLIPIEVKASQTFNSSFLRNLTFYQQLTTTRMPYGFLIYAGSTEQTINNIHLLNFKHSHRCLIVDNPEVQVQDCPYKK